LTPAPVGPIDRAPVDGLPSRGHRQGAQFLTEPLDRKAGLRCYLPDPDGYLVEVGQATGMLEGVFADPPAGNQRCPDHVAKAGVAAPDPVDARELSGPTGS
jgi:hypothetical protein